MEIRRLGSDHVERVVTASPLFDQPVRREVAARFLATDDHHLLVASVDEVDVGFVSGVETTHPDKGTEMLLYELAVDEAHRRRGIGRALVEALAGLAAERGCYGMWVVVDEHDDTAVATYRAAGAAPALPAMTLAWSFADPE